MRIVLKEKPRRPKIIQGFPGFGLVGTIATEFLIDHLDTKKIGKIWVSEMPAMVAVHEGDIVEPIGIFYNKKYNLVIIHAINAIPGVEWKLSNAILEIAKQLKAKEILCLEGIGSTEMSTESKTFYHSTSPHVAAALEKSGCSKLREGIIMGLAGLLMLKSERKIDVSTVFAESHSSLPDSKAAAKVVEVLDQYLGLEVDYKPLIKQAEKFEEKLKGIMSKTKSMDKQQKAKRLSYVG